MTPSYYILERALCEQDAKIALLMKSQNCNEKVGELGVIYKALLKSFRYHFMQELEANMLDEELS